MTLQQIRQTPKTMTVRYYPLFVWWFGVLALYGLGSITAALLGGRTPIGPGSLGAMALLGAFALFVTGVGGQFISCRFDRAGNRISVTRYGLLGRKVTERPLSEVVGLRVRVLRRTQHRIELRLRSGEVLPLTSTPVVTFSNGGIGRIATFLGQQPELIHERPRAPGT